MKLSKVLDAIKEELSKPLPDPRVVQPKAKKEKRMAKKSKPEVDEEELDEEEEAEDEDEEEAPKPKKGKKAAKPAKKAKKGKDEDSDDGFVTLQDLAEEAEIEPQSARVKLRESDLEKPEGGRWRWKDGSKDLKAVRKVLGL